MHYSTCIRGNRGAFGWRASIATEAVIVVGELDTIAKAYRFKSECCMLSQKIRHEDKDRRELQHRLNEFLGRCYERFNYVDQFPDWK